MRQEDQDSLVAALRTLAEQYQDAPP
jgi:hypothetical protein